uniref:Fungal N-terminal domain-containing protein n=1 Tax=Bionectria ochroleuca TaxID=29856 RepID=A0A8H7N5D8_BIOOC
MLVGDIQSTLLVLIKLGVELKARLDALNQAAEDVQLLTTNLRLLLIVFENPANESILKGHVSEFVSILDILESIAKSCAKCAQVLDLDPSGQTAAEGSREAFGRKLIRRICVVKRIPGLLTEIQCKAEQLQKIYSAVSVVILQDIRTNQEQPPTGVGSSTLMT